VSDIIGKLLKFQNLLNDFNLSNVKIYSDYLDKKNNPELEIDKQNTMESRIDGKKTKPFEIHSNGKANNAQNDLNNSQTIDIRSKKTNTSSQNFLIRSNSRLMPEKNK
jgi:hypothetical protein